MAVAGLAALVAPANAQTGDSPITFQDIYSAPDDQELNLAYARQQADKGRLLQAAASLERMLFANRDWDSARLFYASILLRLDDRVGAAREVRLLRTRPLSPDDAARLEAIDAALEGRTTIGTGSEWSGRLALAGRYDDNAGGVFGDIVFGGNDQPDESLQALGVVRYTTPVGKATAYMRATGNLRLHQDITGADFSAFGFAGGLRGKTGGIDYRLEADTTFVDIARESYLDQAGVSARLGTTVFDGLNLGVQGSYHDQDYDPLDTAPTASDRTGSLWQIGPYVDWRPFPKLRLSASARYQDKTARDAGLAYDGWQLDGRARFTLNEDVYLSGRGNYRSLEYKANNVFVFPAGPREDEYISARGAIGMSLAALGQGEGLRPFSIEAAVNYASRDTNILGRGFSNTGGEIRLIYDF